MFIPRPSGPTGAGRLPAGTPALPTCGTGKQGSPRFVDELSNFVLHNNADWKARATPMAIKSLASVTEVL